MSSFVHSDHLRKTDGVFNSKEMFRLEIIVFNVVR